MAEQNYTQQELKWIAEAEAQGIRWLGKSRRHYGNYRLACGHEREIANGDVRRGNFKCQVCLDKKYADEAKAQGITWLGKSRNQYGHYRLACGHEREITNNNVRLGAFECKVCFEQKLKGEAESHGITWLGQTRKSYGNYRLACGHEREITNDCVRKGYFKCQVCHDQKYTDEAEAQGITWLGQSRKRYGHYRLACGHEREIRNGDVRLGTFKCQVCHDQKFKDEAEARGITWLGQTRKGCGNYRLACGHEREIMNHDVRRGTFKCQVCHDQKYTDEAEARGITWLGQSRESYGNYRLACGHEREIRNYDVRIGNFKCQVCLDKKYTDEAEAQGITWLGQSRKGCGNYRLACGHEREITNNNVRLGKFVCHVCEESWATKPSELYVLHIDVHGESLIKVGISGNLDRRISQYGLPDEAKVTVLKTIQFDTGSDAYKAEQSLLRKFKKRRKSDVDHIMRDSGHTECFSPAAMNEIIAAA